MATNPYTNKVIFGNQTVMDLTDDTVEPQNVLQGQTFHDRSGAPQTGTAIGGIPEEELRDTVGWTGKNLLSDENGSSHTFIKGTARTFRYEVGNVVASRGDKFIVSEDITDSASFATSYKWGFKLQTYNNGYTDVSIDYAVSQTDGHFETTATLNQNVSNLYIFAYISNSESSDSATVTINNLMLRYSSITDSTYEPYHKSVDEVAHLTTDTAETDIQDDDYFPFYDTSATAKRKTLWSNIKSLLNGVFFRRVEQRVLGAKNLLPIGYDSYTRQGITGTKESDGTLKINGTPSDTQAYMPINTNNFNYNGVLIKSGVTFIPSTGTDYKLEFRYSDGTYHNELPNGVAFTADKDIAFFYVTIKTSVTDLIIYPMLRLASDPDSTYVPYAKTNKQLTDGLNNTLITISKAEYDALSSTEQNDPNKTYYVYDDESDIGYYELEVTLTSAVASGGTIRIPASGTDSHITTNCTIIPTSELKSDGTPYGYSSIVGSTGYVTITAGEAIPASTKIGVVVYN